MRGILQAAILAGLLVSAGLLTSAPAHAACPDGQFEDSVTRMCWTQIAPELSLGMSGQGPCLPGRLGNCVGRLSTSAGTLQDTWGP